MHAIDHYAYRNRLRHRHPAEKLLFSLGMLSLGLLLPPWPASLVTFSLCAGATLGAGVPARSLARLLAVPLGFLLSGALPLCLSLGAGGLSLDPDGARSAFGLLGRGLSGLSATLFLSLTTPAPDLLSLWRRMGAPDFVISLASLLYRFLFLLSETAAAVSTAQGARLGFATWRTSFRSFGYLARALFLRTLSRAERLERGLLARGFTGVFPVLPGPAPSRPVLLGLSLFLAGLGLSLYQLGARP